MKDDFYETLAEATKSGRDLVYEHLPRLMAAIQAKSDGAVKHELGEMAFSIQQELDKLRREPLGEVASIAREMIKSPAMCNADHAWNAALLSLIDRIRTQEPKR